MPWYHGVTEHHGGVGLPQMVVVKRTSKNEVMVPVVG